MKRDLIMEEWMEFARKRPAMGGHQPSAWCLAFPMLCQEWWRAVWLLDPKEDAMGMKRTVRIDVDVDLNQLREDLLRYSSETLSRATKQAIEGNEMSLVAARIDPVSRAGLSLRFEYEEVIKTEDEEGIWDGENSQTGSA